MKRFLLRILLIVFSITMLFGITGCDNLSFLEKKEKEGYAISVTYNANGGKFVGRSGISIMDMFNPSNYQEDGGGYVHIKLIEPTDETRSTGTDGIDLSRQEYFLAGWYQERTVKKNGNGAVIDDDGNELVKAEGQDGVDDENCLYLNQDGKQTLPAYTYDKLWNFETDTIDYKKEDGTVSMTLYAGWVKEFKFTYYFNQDGEWVDSGNVTTFDYIATNEVGSTTFDRNTIFLPKWDGAMNYKGSYNDGTPFTFPSLSGTTFSKAYYLNSDSEMVSIDGEKFVHQGLLDIETGTAINPEQKIFIETIEGDNYYKIETAEQLSKNGNLEGDYEILADLDFTGIKWPNGFTLNEFNGKMYSSSGNKYTIKNVNIIHTSSNDSGVYGGLFGCLSQNSQIKDLTFQNITYTISSTKNRLRDSYFGTFAGKTDGSDISNVSLKGLVLKIGYVVFDNSTSVNLVVNGDITGLDIQDNVELYVFGQVLGDIIRYQIDIESVEVDDSNKVLLTFKNATLEKEEYKIDYEKE